MHSYFVFITYLILGGFAALIIVGTIAYIFDIKNEGKAEQKKLEAETIGYRDEPIN